MFVRNTPVKERSQPVFKAKFGYIFEQYKDRSFYYTTVILFGNLCMAVGSTFLSRSAVPQLVIIIFICAAQVCVCVCARCCRASWYHVVSK